MVVVNMVTKHPIELVDIESLKPDPSNPNQMTEREFAGLKNSLSDFGDLDIVVVDQDNMIINGHHRVSACRELGEKQIEVRRVVCVTEAERRIIRQTLQKLRGRHDPMKDADELLAILKSNQEKRLFDTAAMRETDFYKALAQCGKAEKKDDAVPELDTTNVVTQKGDVWILGPHKLMCGDSTSPADAATLMGKDAAHIVITDPPYGVDYVESIKGREGKAKWRNIAGDDLKGNALQEFCEKFLTNIRNFTTEDSAYYIFFGMKTFHHLLAAFDAVKIYYALPLIWSKARPTISWAKYHPDYEVLAYGGRGPTPAVTKNEAKVSKRKVYASGASRNNYKPDYEPVAFSGEGAKPNQSRWFAHYNQTTTWLERPDTSSDYVHPTQKPVSLAERALLNSSVEGEICLDLFAGSGFSLITSHKLKRLWRGMELDPAYCDCIVKRFEAYTGICAVNERIRKGEAA